METSWYIWWGLGLLATYLLGSIPFGLLIALAKGIDVRRHGSTNIGSANVGRTLGRKYGVLTFLLDGAKGFVPVFVSGWVMGTINRPDTPPAMAWAWLAFGVAAILGHIFPVWLKFKGGKGVATGFGAVLAVFPILGIPAILSIALWFILVKVTRYIGLSSCIAAVTLPLWVFAVYPMCKELGIFFERMSRYADRSDWVLWPYLTAAVGMAVLVVYAHRGNLRRMLEGTELRVGERARSVAPAESPGRS
ncbi:MAG: glycerol-3-phosphate 1-O-acyltransferase PlsY [Phycisphaeraceae bacterium]|nr:glycerol-3-phosphate 1-O-acyltransferase PlsY [Phycisphaeraceae bacterium]